MRGFVFRALLNNYKRKWRHGITQMIGNADSTCIPLTSGMANLLYSTCINTPGINTRRINGGVVPKTKKELTLDEAINEVDAILDEHFSQLSPTEAEEKRKAFHDYVSRACDGDQK